MSDATEKYSASIVLIGQFNPAIFSPAWMCRIGAVSDDTLESAVVTLIHRDIAQFTVGPFTFDIRRGRFSIEVTGEPLVQALDAILLIFGEQLNHTPVSEFGINYTEHFRLDSAERRIAFGRRLAPLEPWGKYGTEIAELTGVLTSGVIDIVMFKSYDPPNTGGLRVQVEPSSVIEPSNVGVAILVNDHRIFNDANDTRGAGAAIELLSAIFDESIASHRQIADQMYSFARDLPL